MNSQDNTNVINNTSTKLKEQIIKVNEEILRDECKTREIRHSLDNSIKEQEQLNVVYKIDYIPSEMDEDNQKDKKRIDTEEYFQGNFNIISNAKKFQIKQKKYATGFKYNIGDLDKKLKFYDDIKQSQDKKSSKMISVKLDNKEINSNNTFSKSSTNFNRNSNTNINAHSTTNGFRTNKFNTTKNEFNNFLKPFTSSTLVTPYMKYKSDQNNYFKNITDIKTRKTESNMKHLHINYGYLQVPEIGESLVYVYDYNNNNNSSTISHNKSKSLTTHRTLIPNFSNKMNKTNKIFSSNTTKYTCFLEKDKERDKERDNGKDKDRKKHMSTNTEKNTINDESLINESNIIKRSMTNKNIFKSLESLATINENQMKSSNSSLMITNFVNCFDEKNSLPELKTDNEWRMYVGVKDYLL